MVIEWDWAGWFTKRDDGYKLNYFAGIMIASHPEKQSRCMIIIVGPLSIGLPWFRA